MDDPLPQYVPPGNRNGNGTFLQRLESRTKRHVAKKEHFVRHKAAALTVRATKCVVPSR